MHRHFEELCALASTGQLEPAAAHELQGHLQSCDTCRASLRDLRNLSTRTMPLVGADRVRATVAPPSGMRERFVRAAAANGIEMQLGPALHPGIAISGASDVQLGDKVDRAAQKRL